jgi:hypothetical protein
MSTSTRWDLSEVQFAHESRPVKKNNCHVPVGVIIFDVSRAKGGNNKVEDARVSKL